MQFPGSQIFEQNRHHFSSTLNIDAQDIQDEIRKANRLSNYPVDPAYPC